MVHTVRMVTSRPLAAAWRSAVLVAVVVGLALLRVPRPPTLCLLREATGIPCPMCGFTTAAVRLGHADLVGAAGASPLAVAVCAGFVLVPFIRRSRAATFWRELPNRWRQLLPVFAIVAILAFAEIWQLQRFGII
ncbi:hypothetical protein Airi01_019660 [Actinoallomurus iriomotensis]|uniref:DUF2752 domain-containing protein n=2 Tax=Thermomonosporaceae TaxID=2012 RepID=A0A9W6RD80_9ACTN|nr:hypothetical protein Airi01_019660 [Actinoallomurus iriomotensis]